MPLPKTVPAAFAASIRIPITASLLPSRTTLPPATMVGLEISGPSVVVRPVSAGIIQSGASASGFSDDKQRLVVKQTDATVDSQVCSCIVGSRNDTNDVHTRVVRKGSSLQRAVRILKRTSSCRRRIRIDIQNIVGKPGCQC